MPALRLIAVLLVGAILAGCATTVPVPPATEALEDFAWAENETRILVFERVSGRFVTDAETVTHGPPPELNAVNGTVRDDPPFRHRPRLAAIVDGKGAAAGTHQAFILRSGEFVVHATTDATASWIHVGWLWSGPACRITVQRGDDAALETERSHYMRVSAGETVLVEVSPPERMTGSCPTFSFRVTDRGVWQWAS